MNVTQQHIPSGAPARTFRLGVEDTSRVRMSLQQAEVSSHRSGELNNNQESEGRFKRLTIRFQWDEAKGDGTPVFDAVSEEASQGRGL